MGLGAVIVTVALLSLAISAESSPLRSYTITPVSNAQTLYRQVAARRRSQECQKTSNLIPVGGNESGVVNFENASVPSIRVPVERRASASSETRRPDGLWWSTAIHTP